MSLQSFGFFGFLLVVAAVYLHLPQRWQSAFLLAASWVFYALAMPSMLPVTIAIAVFTYLCGCGMTAREGARKTAFLRIGVAGLLAILAFFKYNGAFASDGGWQAVAMPLGISFYSFAAISYLIDAARGDCEVEKNFIDCALFLNFFATVTQGPICRAGALLPQFKEEHRFDAARTVRALRLMALGLFKLVAVSDVLGLLVDEVFPNYRSYGGPMLVLAAVFYTFQLYFNFSGYSEVARAVGLLLGLELPENFKTPFFATNFSGFWSRWHISFSSWLQDYLFMPLAWADVSGLTGGKISRLPAEFCVFTVFFISGFWHGNAALCGVGPFAGQLPPGRGAAAPSFGQAEKESPGPRAVGQARRCVCAVVREHGVLPCRVVPRRRTADRRGCVRVSGPLLYGLGPRAVCVGAVHRRVRRILCQCHHGRGVLRVCGAGAGAGVLP